MTGRASENRVRKYLCGVWGHEWKPCGQIDRICIHCGRVESFLDGGLKDSMR